MKTVKYGDAEKTFLFVVFNNESTTTVPCDVNNALYAKIIASGVTIQPYN